MSAKESKVVDIQLSVPSFKAAVPVYRHAKRHLRRISRKQALILGAVALVGLSAVGSYQFMAKRTAKATLAGTPGAAVRAAVLVKGTPEYPTYLPAGKDIDALGGWTRVSPADRNPVFAYADSIGTAKISVSQQPLPNDFKTDTDIQVAELAKSFNARDKVVVGDVTAYVGTSIKGPQSVIFAKDNTLVLIKSAGRLQDADWASYISSLQKS